MHLINEKKMEIKISRNRKASSINNLGDQVTLRLTFNKVTPLDYLNDNVTLILNKLDIYV